LFPACTGGRAPLLAMLWGVDPIGIVHRYVIFTGMNKISINSSGGSGVKKFSFAYFRCRGKGLPSDSVSQFPRFAGQRILQIALNVFDWLQIARSFIATFTFLFRFPLKSEWHFKS
jgi:hypothetical protein